MLSFSLEPDPICVQEKYRGRGASSQSRISSKNRLNTFFVGGATQVQKGLWRRVLILCAPLSDVLFVLWWVASLFIVVVLSVFFGSFLGFVFSVASQ